MIKLFNIIHGWKNYVIKNPATELQAEKRAKICAECPHSSQLMLLEVMVRDEIKEIQGHQCNECGCPLSMKVRSKEESCPIDKW